MTYLDISTDQRRDGAVVTATGEVDLDSAPVLQEALFAALDGAASARVLVALPDVTFMDSTGLHALLTAASAATRRGGWLRLVAPSARVTRVIEITGLQELLPAYDDAAAALRDIPSRTDAVVPPPRFARSTSST